ncbi:hypothetical protein EJP75_08345 [Acinetobacter baumannii]|nr:hypothetical protein EJP75_08345 [Acinetobacter baumannii]
MKKFVLVGLFLSSSAFASDSDRLNELSRTLVDGSYTPSEKILLPDVSSQQVELKEKTVGLPDYYTKWSLGICQKDRFTNEKSCEIRKNELMVRISNGKTYVWILGADYPNKSAALKIDENKTFYGNEGNFKDSGAIIKQMKSGKVAYIRYSKWPYLLNNDKEIGLDGFADLYQILLSEYKTIK